jgi:hypothetical protein
MLDPLPAAILRLIFGTCLCFFGRKLIIFALAVACFLLSWVYGGQIITSLTDSSFLLTWGPWLIGILGAVLGILLYKLSVFAAGALIAWFFLEPYIPDIHIVICVVASLAAGALLLAFRKPILSGLTALLGSSLIALAIVTLLAHVAIFAGPVIYWVLVTALAIFGFVVQMRIGKGK